MGGWVVHYQGTNGPTFARVAYGLEVDALAACASFDVPCWVRWHRELPSGCVVGGWLRHRVR